MRKWISKIIIILLLPISILCGTGCTSDDGPPITYIVSFYSGTESYLYNEIEVKAGSKLTAEQRPATPERTGYIFIGWYKDNTCTTMWDFDKDTIDQDTKLFAGWEEAQNQDAPTE